MLVLNQSYGCLYHNYLAKLAFIKDEDDRGGYAGFLTDFRCSSCLMLVDQVNCRLAVCCHGKSGLWRGFIITYSIHGAGLSIAEKHADGSKLAECMH